MWTLAGVLVAGRVWAQEPAALPDLLQAEVAAYEAPFRAATAAPPATVAAPKPVTSVAMAAEPPLSQEVRTVAALQIVLDRRGFGIGLIDGQTGFKTRQALLDFRYAGANLSEATAARQQLLDDPAPKFVLYEVTTNDLAQVGEATKDWEEAADLPAMACHTLLDWLSEKFHAQQGFLRLLNPGVKDWGPGLAGSVFLLFSVRVTCVMCM